MWVSLCTLNHNSMCCVSFSWCHCVTFSFSLLFRHEESPIGLQAASQHPWLVLMGVLVPETAPNQGEDPVQKSLRRHGVLVQLQLLVPQQHLSHLHTLPITKVSSTAKRPPPLTLKLSREAQTGKTLLTEITQTVCWTNYLISNHTIMLPIICSL